MDRFPRDFFFLKLQVREDCHLVGGRNWGGI